MERSGGTALGAEGLILVGALAGVGASLVTARLPSGAGFIAHGRCRAWCRNCFALDGTGHCASIQVIAGLALVFFLAGLTGLLGYSDDWTKQAGVGF